MAWEQDFDAYLTFLDEAPASFIVDLAAAAHAPVASHELRVQVRVAMREPREDGLRNSDEADTLADAEDAIVEHLARCCGAVFVGHMISEGSLHVICYAEHARVSEPATLLEGVGVRDYEIAWLVEEDPEWGMYFEFLFPDPLEFQLIQNRRLLAQFSAGGDVLSAERRVDHCALFEACSEAREASEVLREEGFEVSQPEASESGHWVVEFHRKERLDEDRPDAFCLEIIELLEPFDASYDGWGAALMCSPTTH